MFQPLMKPGFQCQVSYLCSSQHPSPPPPFTNLTYEGEEKLQYNMNNAQEVQRESQYK